MVRHFDAVTPPPLDPRIVPADPANATVLAEIATRAFDPDRQRYGSGPPGLDDADVHRRIASTAHAHEVWSGGKLAGVVLSGPETPHNRAAIENYGRVRVLAEIPPVEPLTAAALRRISPACDLRQL